jgi:hypothetical protein
MRRVLLLLATAISAAVLCRPAAAQTAQGYIGVSATVLPAPATASVGSEVTVRQTRRGVEVSAPLTRGGTGPALITVERRQDGAERCALDGASAVSTGRVTCSLSLAEASGAGGADVPVTILIVPAT